jgi:hypothetical protein
MRIQASKIGKVKNRTVSGVEVCVIFEMYFLDGVAITVFSRLDMAILTDDSIGTEILQKYSILRQFQQLLMEPKKQNPIRD